ncbi:type VI secretion system protein TssA [Halopseudomonas sabulinigri]|uniref:Type VI secretion system protein TssA n=1 Tax=Halopseudomonas sabulinigri TaxID=472181 RepID=A0ABP9ZK29_9GAMM
MQLQTINTIASSPINETSFAGEDVRYSSEYEELERELAKAGSLHDNQQPDWEVVRDGSLTILGSQSKDLRVAAWLCWSLLETDGVAGLCSGLQMLGSLCDSHWQELHPRKDRTRIAALNWLFARLESSAEQRLNSETEVLVSALQHLQQALAAHLKEQAPDLQPLCRKAKAAQQKPAPAPVVTPVSDSSAPVTTTQSTPGPISNAKDAHKALRLLQDHARPLCHWWLRDNQCDLRALRLSRTLLWLPIDALPSHDANHKTGLRNLPTDRIAAYRERLSQGQHAALLTDIEASLARAPFWLDGQYLAWQCCDALGASDAAEEIELQLAWQLTRLPGLEKLRFFDDTPFADDSTLDWINSRVLAHGAAAQPATITFARGAEQPLAAWDQGLEEALSTLRKTGLKDAVQALGGQIKQARGERAAFYWRLAQARLCFQARQYELAKAQLETLHQQLQAYGLDKWEPDLNLDVLRLLHSCCDLLPQNQNTRERKDEIYHRLCHLDLGVVLEQALGA